MAEAVNALYKAELIRAQAPWKTIEQVELATLKYVWWWNNERLYGELDMRTPADVEAAYYAVTEPLPALTLVTDKPVGTKVRPNHLAAPWFNR